MTADVAPDPSRGLAIGLHELGKSPLAFADMGIECPASYPTDQFVWGQVIWLDVRCTIPRVSPDGNEHRAEDFSGPNL